MLLSTTPKPFRRYLPLWLSVCCISAAPSFVLAVVGISQPNVAAMVLGVLIFVFIYSAINASQFYHDRITTTPLLHKALSAGFTLRLILTVLTLLTFVPGMRLHFFLLCDAFPGVVALTATKFLLVETLAIYGSDYESAFFPTLLITLLQGVFLSFIVLFASMVLWGLLYLLNSKHKTKVGAA